MAFSFKVSNRLLKGLEMLYEHSAPTDLVLAPDKNQSLEWKIVCDSFSPELGDYTIQKEYNSTINKQGLYFSIIEYLNENLDQMKNINRLRGGAYNELSNYRSVQLKTGMCSLVVEKSHSATLKDRSDDTLYNGLKNFAKPFETRPKNQRRSDSPFLQTLSDFGKKIRQILVSKEDLLSFPYPKQLANLGIWKKHKDSENTEVAQSMISEINETNVSGCLLETPKKIQMNRKILQFKIYYQT